MATVDSTPRWAEALIQQHAKEEREQLLRFLKSMDVDFPSTSKISTDVLERKLKLALDYAQELKTVDTLPLQPSAYPLWKVSHPNRNISDAMARVSIIEGMKMDAAQALGYSGKFRLYENTFNDLRNTLMNIAHGLDKGTTSFVLQDQAQSKAICLRVVDVYEIDQGVPLLTVLYEFKDDTVPEKHTVQFMMDLAKDGRLPVIKCTLEEQALLRRLLVLNSTRMSPDYQPERRPFEKTFKTSFFLPTGPLGLEEIGKLTSRSGCEVCGRENVKKCSQCQIVSYCSSACQKSDWKQHKPVCRSLQGATWHPVCFVTNPMREDGKKQFVYHQDRRKAPSLASLTSSNHDDAPSPNVHGSAPFLVKIQRPLTTTDTSSKLNGMLLVYDQERSFKVHVQQADDPKVYQTAMETILADEQSNGLKTYRWARRTGDWELSVCFDQAPEQDTTW